MKKMKLLIITMIMLMVCITGCQNVENVKEEIAGAIEQDDFETLELTLKKADMESCVGDAEFSQFIQSQIQILYDAESDKITHLLYLLESNGYKDESIIEFISNTYFSEKATLTERLAKSKYFQELSYYHVEGVTEEEILNYVDKIGQEIDWVSGEVSWSIGYYSDENNWFEDKDREIQSNGDIITTLHQYFGDFAIEVMDREYVDELYEIQHEITEKLYFRGCEVTEIGAIDRIVYAPPYLLCTSGEKTTMYDVDNSDVADEICTFNFVLKSGYTTYTMKALQEYKACLKNFTAKELRYANAFYRFAGNPRMLTSNGKSIVVLGMQEFADGWAVYYKCDNTSGKIFTWTDYDSLDWHDDSEEYLFDWDTEINNDNINEILQYKFDIELEGM